MKQQIKIILILFLLINICFVVRAQTPASEKVFLITDRISCVSGDTVWFMTDLATENPIHSNIIHVQLDAEDNRHITKSIIKCLNDKGNGYIVVPDSLSTGVYFLKAFTNFQKYFSNSVITVKPLVVYNRFAESIVKIVAPTQLNTNIAVVPSVFRINTQKQVFKPNEKVSLNISTPDSLKNNISDLIISARLIDPFSENISIESGFLLINQTEEEPVLENDGILITGQILNAETSEPEPGITVMLSIADSIPYFDYYYSDKDGYFHFFLKKVSGLADLIIQPAPNPDKTFRIKLFDNFAETGEKINREEIMINEKQAEVIGTILKTSRYSRYFDVPELNNIQEFIKPPRFKHPFYGKPTTTVYPRDYVELDNFNEISKELLQASKYRERKDTISLKLINFDTNDFFDSEPFMLLDGIPIFDTKLLISKNSESIDRIDVLAEERCFGDMNFDGVLAVYSYDNKLNWLNKVPNLFRFNSQTVQFPIVKQNHNYEINKEPNIPDLRKVICWQRLNGPDYDTNRQVNFRLPDIKGNYLITITTITKTGNVITDTKEIEVR